MEPEGLVLPSQEPATYPILGQTDRVHVSQPHFLKIHFSIILPSTPRPSKWPLFLGFPNQNFVCTPPLPYMLHALPILFFLIRSSEKYLEWSAGHEAPHHVVFSIPMLPLSA